MARVPVSLVVALAVAGAGACAGVDDVVVTADASVAPDLASDSQPDRGPPNPYGCSDYFSDFISNPRSADVLIVLDRSGSMDMAFGASTRYEAIEAALASVVQTYAAHVRFGYEEMPGRQACASQPLGMCCASPPIVPIADGNTQAMVDALSAAPPMDGATPTAGALQAAQDFYRALDDGIDNRYVLLATDGVPNCTLAGSLSAATAAGELSSACRDAVAEVEALVGLGIRVAVLGLGPGVADDATGSTACLDALAHAGGAEASPGSPGFFATSDPVSLETAIEQIFGGVNRPSCRLGLKQALDPTATPNGAIYLDGQPIARPSWSLDQSQKLPSVVITGAACDRIQHFQVTTVEVQYTCLGSST